MITSSVRRTEQQPERGMLLRRALQANALFCALSGIALAAGATPLGVLFGMPAFYLQVLGVILLPYTAFIGYGATRPALDRRIAWISTIVDALWAIDSLILLATGFLLLTTTGWWFVLIQALIAADFAIVQYAGMRRVQTIA
jgi:hypothetical protein